MEESIYSARYWNFGFFTLTFVTGTNFYFNLQVNETDVSMETEWQKAGESIGTEQLKENQFLQVRFLFELSRNVNCLCEFVQHPIYPAIARSNPPDAAFTYCLPEFRMPEDTRV